MGKHNNKKVLHEMMATEIIRMHPDLYRGHADDALKFARNQARTRAEAECWCQVQGLLPYPWQGQAAKQ